MKIIDRAEVKDYRDNPNLSMLNIAACNKVQVKQMNGYMLENALSDLRQIFILFEDGDDWR